ncbi:NAD(+) diphosphatase [Mycetocola tolaasinivorans]|uniref:NAD(+) diphosphatase n=1 Tax=Mycetocola tolaasinivorans TaxID=76635 RepID=A0A3L7A8H2_9MICO|nr:NAD(+) diphosphatase [Mycetocola tolaasinivorans]RLP76467.1 NAD(+) diphosphatase [Mycetocola tolaasinivorans]
MPNNTQAAADRPDSFGLLADLPLSRSGVDRDYTTREIETLADDLRADPDARYLLMRGGTTAVEHGRLRLFRASELPADVAALAPTFLGRVQDAEAGIPPRARVSSLDLDALNPEGPAADPAVPTPADDAASAAHAEGEWGSLRDYGAVFGALDAGLLTEALALANWHRSSTFCSRCGHRTALRQAGWSRHCPNCGAEHFPRTDPAIIVLVTDAEDRVLLGSNALWRAGQYSLLAGFVEAGESLEQAVVREIFEEAGVRVVNPVYRGSQPWPLPRSLMLGYTARVAPDADPASAIPDGEEILDLRWFSRESLRAEATTLTLPGKTSIARALLDDWLIADGGPDIQRVQEGGTGAPWA